MICFSFSSSTFNSDVQRRNSPGCLMSIRVLSPSARTFAFLVIAFLLFRRAACPPQSLESAHGTWFDSRSEEHTSELQSLMRISYAVFCLKKNTNQHQTHKYRY